MPLMQLQPLKMLAVAGLILTTLSFASPGDSSDPAGMDDAKGITISGKVLKDNTPVSDARVYIYEINAYTIEGGIIKEGKTQADGSFQFEIPKRDDKEWRSFMLRVVAQHPQYSFGWAGLSKGNTTDILIELRQPAVIMGIVTDQAGNPIQRAEARISWLSLPKAGQQFGDSISGDALPDHPAKTDSDGKFALHSLPEGSNASLDIIGSGYAKERMFNVPAGTAGITLKLKPEARIEGRMTFGETSGPAKDIKVGCQGLYPTMGWAQAYTDENGDYALTNLPAGTYNVGLAKMIPDWTAAAREYIAASEGETVENVDLKLVKGGFITGRVTDKDTGEPILEHNIGFHDAARPESQAAIFSAETDENGFYSFRAAPGKALVYSRAPEGYEKVGEVKQYVDVVEGETVSVDLQFRKGAPYTGCVLTFDGEPVAGAVITDRVSSFKQYGKTDQDGKFTIAGPQPGQKVLLKVEHKELKLRAYAELEAQPGVEMEILMEEYETVDVSGRVVDRQGKPVPLAEIRLLIWDEDAGYGIEPSVGMTNSSGEYKIPELIVGDKYQVSAKAEGYRKASIDMFSPTVDMSALPDIVLFPGGFFLEGTVTDTDGNPVAAARVTARSEHIGTRTDADGHYRLEDLPLSVEIEVSIEHPDYGHSLFQYVPMNQTQDFVIVRGDGYLAGKVVDADGNPVERAHVYIYSRADESSGHVNMVASTNSQGEFRLKNLLAGERESIYVGKMGLHRIFEDVEMNREDVVFVLKEEEPAKPTEPSTPEETARREYARNADERFKELLGKTAPGLEVAQWLHGEPVTLAELKGKVVALHFWASQHVREVERIRFLSVLQKVYGEKGLVCVGIHKFTAEADGPKALIAEKEATYRIAVDKESSVAGAKGATFDKYAVAWFPSVILIDRNGVIHDNVRDEELEETIQKLLSE